MTSKSFCAMGKELIGWLEAVFLGVLISAGLHIGDWIFPDTPIKLEHRTEHWVCVDDESCRRLNEKKPLSDDWGAR